MHQNSLEKGQLFDNLELQSDVKSALDGIDQSRQNLKYDLGKNESLPIHPPLSHFQETEEIKFSYVGKDHRPQVRTATVNKLIERLTYPSDEDIYFQKIFLTTYRQFLKPSELLEKLIIRYCVTPAFDNLAISGRNLHSIHKNQQIPIRLRVLNVIKYWVYKKKTKKKRCVLIDFCRWTNISLWILWEMNS